MIFWWGSKKAFIWTNMAAYKPVKDRYSDVSEDSTKIKSVATLINTTKFYCFLLAWQAAIKNGCFQLLEGRHISLSSKVWGFSNIPAMC